MNILCFRSKKIKHKKRSNEDLIKAKEVLKYELDMLSSLHLLLKSNKINNVAIRNALIESFAVHTRILIHFFYTPKSRSTDVVADEFFEDPKIWYKTRPRITKFLEKSISMANKQVSHFTEDRLELPKEDKTWLFDKIVDDINKVVNKFYEKA
jgi:hypothetical protein